MQMQTKDVSRKALSSTQRSLKQLEQTTQMAGATLEKMHDQVNTSHHALSVLLCHWILGSLRLQPAFARKPGTQSC